MNKNIIIIGSSGHSKVITDIILKSGDFVLGFIDDNISIEIPFGMQYLGNIESINNIVNQYPDAYFIIAIGNNLVRKRIAENYDLNYYTAIHPNATLGLDVKIGVGTCVMSNSVINPSTYIGKHCIINTSAIVEHDNIICDFVHVSPNVSLGGTVKIGELSHIGIGSIVKNGVSICKNVTIGAGAVVVNDIFESGVYIGIPAKRK